MDRRTFLSGALGASALTLAGCASPPPNAAAPTPLSVAPAVLPVTELAPAPELLKISYPGGALFQLPGEGNLMAWTVDDGASEEAVRAYVNYAKAHARRLTFFVTGMYPVWPNIVDQLAPLVERGQIQLANHTMNHPSFTASSDGQVQDELMSTHQLMQSLYGVDMRPYYRPALRASGCSHRRRRCCRRIHQTDHVVRHPWRRCPEVTRRSRCPR